MNTVVTETVKHGCKVNVVNHLYLFVLQILVNDVNFLAGDFVWRFNGCADRHAPIEKLKPKHIKLRLKPWITPDQR